MGLDYSTIDLDYLARYDVLEKELERFVQSKLGMGCFLDAPGYPSYFVQKAYFPATLRLMDLVVLQHPHTGDYHIVGSPTNWQERLHVFYRPVSSDSLRFATWEVQCYLHWYGCQYRDERNQHGSHAWDGVNFRILSEHWFRTERGSEESSLLYQELLAHYAAWHIRSFYPNYTFHLDLAVYTPQDYRSAFGRELPCPYNQFRYQGGFRDMNLNNRWWERHATPRQVTIDGLERFPTQMKGS